MLRSVILGHQVFGRLQGRVKLSDNRFHGVLQSTVSLHLFRDGDHFLQNGGDALYTDSEGVFGFSFQIIGIQSNIIDSIRAIHRTIDSISIARVAIHVGYLD